MTNEQLIVYLYGIYPSGGITIVLALLAGVLMRMSFVSYREYRDNMKHYSNPEIKERVEKEYKNKEVLFQKLMPYTKISVTLFLISSITGYFIPNKNTFVAIVATPTIVSMAESNTTKDVGSIVQMIISKTKKELEEELK